MSSGATEAGGKLRTFVAIELPQEVLDECGRIQGDLAAATDRGVVRWVSREGIHLTLKFLGSTSVDLLPEIEQRLRDSLAEVRAFSVGLGPLGAFPGARAPRVVWVGLSGDLTALVEVQRRVEAAISPLGYPTEQRPFSPHLTLGRVADLASPADRQALGALVTRSALPMRVPFEVSEVSLIRSQLSPSGARYSRLLAVSLGS